MREHARWLREEAQRVREEAGARFTSGEQDWDIPPGWAERPSWTEWPGRRGWEDWTRTRGRRGWTGALDFGTLKDLERVAVQFTADLRKLAMQSSVVGENVITDLRTILEEALERIKTEIFGPEGGEQGPEGGEQSPEGGEQSPEGGEQGALAAPAAPPGRGEQGLGLLARVSEIRGESRLFRLVSYGAGGGFGVLPMSALGGVAGEPENYPCQRLGA